MSTRLHIMTYWSRARFLLRSFQQYIGSFAIMLLLGLVSGGFESIGIASVIPLFYLVTGQEQLQGTERISKLIQWVFSFLHLTLQPSTLLVFIAGLFILKAVVQVTTKYISAMTVASFEENARRILFRRTLTTSWQFLSQQRLGYLESVLVTDIERSSALMAGLASLITTCTTFFMYIVVASTISGRITVITLVLGLSLLICFRPFFSRIRKLQADSVATQKELNHHVTEHMLSAKSIKALAVEQPVIGGAYSLFEKLKTVRVRTSLFRQSTLAVIEPVGFILIAGLFIFSYRRPGFAFASFAVIMYLVNQMFGYVQSLQSQIHTVNELVPHLRSVFKYRRSVKQGQEIDSGVGQFSFVNSIEFTNVSFAYDSDRPVFKNLNLTVHRGEHVAIVGPSGVGKTSLVDLLLRLYTPNSGIIEIDSKDISGFELRSWRRNMGYVPQDGLLLNTSVRENIRFYDHRISEEDIISAAKAAYIYDTIMTLPNGFNTVTGERGVQLSGGQRQRIILARALARNPAVLILDEATSSIDGESEALIQKATESLRGRTTVISITHRITSTMTTDRIIVLGSGGVTEDGAPKELLANPSSYISRLLETSGMR